MNSSPSTVTVWKAGKLALRPATPPFEFSRERWIGAALLMLSAIVFSIFVAVLERDVDRGRLQHAEQRARAVAEAQCEAAQPAESRGTCIALFNGDVVAASAKADHSEDDRSPDRQAAAPVNALYEQESGMHLSSASLSTLSGPGQ
jgi:hypothetical protein